MPGPLALALMVVAAGAAASNASLDTEDRRQVRRWIEGMQKSYRGPYERIAWFCKDGTIKKPHAFACVDHGGGVQHAVFNKHAIELGKKGLWVGTILAALEPEQLAGNDYDRARALVLERYLERADDGWVVRRARSYRGARQQEDEIHAAEKLLTALLAERALFERDRLLAIRLVRALPYGGVQRLAERMRDLAGEIGEMDEDFERLRYKIHAFPEPSDIGAVEKYRRGASGEARKLASDLLRTMRGFYSGYGRTVRLRELYDAIEDEPTRAELALWLAQNRDDLFATTARGASLVEAASRALKPGRGAENLHLLLLAGLLEEEWLQLTGRLRDAPLSRDDALGVLGNLLVIARHTGWLTPHEHRSAKQSLELASRGDPRSYAEGVAGLSNVAAWAQARITQALEPARSRYLAVEPKTAGVVDDALRSSIMHPLAALLDRLDDDVESIRGANHRLLGLGRVESAPVRGLNPGLAKGRLVVVASPKDLAKLERTDVVLLADLPPELPPVAGILTRTPGQCLSHVAMLSRNLGIPYASVGDDVYAAASKHDGKTFVVGVSAGRRVLAGPASAMPKSLLPAPEQTAEEPMSLRIDIDALDLETTRILRLAELGPDDAGKRVGPKAAEVAHLYRLFPGRVPNAAVVPFGAFLSHVDRRGPHGEPSPIERLVDAYEARASGRLDEKGLLAELAEFRSSIKRLPFPEGFETAVWWALRDLGEPGSFGVFVRSDTNVEDLETFTGAGLNQTVANVVDPAEILAAIREVWASPFSERSFHWRQRLLVNPAFVFPSVILHRTVPGEVSGVMVTSDLRRGHARGLTISAGEGVAAVVDGGQGETVVVDAAERLWHLTTSHALTCKRIPDAPQSGVIVDRTRSRGQSLLDDRKIAELRALAREVLLEMPPSKGRPWDIEYAFTGHHAWLLQIRPLSASDSAASNPVLLALDAEATLRANALAMNETLP